MVSASKLSMPLNDISGNRNRGWSMETTSTEDCVVYPGSGKRHPIRQPENAPSLPLAEKHAGFAYFLKKHSSPTHQRVTAGGRIVPMGQNTAPPQFTLLINNLARADGVSPMSRASEDRAVRGSGSSSTHCGDRESPNPGMESSTKPEQSSATTKTANHLCIDSLPKLCASRPWQDAKLHDLQQASFTSTKASVVDDSPENGPACDLAQTCHERFPYAMVPSSLPSAFPLYAMQHQGRGFIYSAVAPTLAAEYPVTSASLSSPVAMMAAGLCTAGTTSTTPVLPHHQNQTLEGTQLSSTAFTNTAAQPPNRNTAHVEIATHRTALYATAEFDRLSRQLDDLDKYTAMHRDELDPLQRAACAEVRSNIVMQRAAARQNMHNQQPVLVQNNSKAPITGAHMHPTTFKFPQLTPEDRPEAVAIHRLNVRAASWTPSGALSDTHATTLMAKNYMTGCAAQELSFETANGVDLSLKHSSRIEIKKPKEDTPLKVETKIPNSVSESRPSDDPFTDQPATSVKRTNISEPSPVDEWGVRIGTAPPELERQQSEMEEMLASESSGSSPLPAAVFTPEESPCKGEECYNPGDVRNQNGGGRRTASEQRDEAMISTGRGFGDPPHGAWMMKPPNAFGNNSMLPKIDRLQAHALHHCEECSQQSGSSCNSIYSDNDHKPSEEKEISAAPDDERTATAHYDHGRLVLSREESDKILKEFYRMGRKRRSVGSSRQCPKHNHVEKKPAETQKWVDGLQDTSNIPPGCALPWVNASGRSPYFNKSKSSVATQNIHVISGWPRPFDGAANSRKPTTQEPGTYTQHFITSRKQYQQPAREVSFGPMRRGLLQTVDEDENIFRNRELRHAF